MPPKRRYRSVFNVRLPRSKPSDHPDHPDFDLQDAFLPINYSTPYRTFVDKGGRKRKKKEPPNASSSTAPTPTPSSTSSSSYASSTLPPGASASHHTHRSDITQQDLDGFGQEGVRVDEKDLGGIDLASGNALGSTLYTRVDNSDSPSHPTHPTHRQPYESARPVQPAPTPPNTARREGHLEYINLDAEHRKSLRAKLFGRFLEFRQHSKLHLRPLVSEDNLDDHDAPPPCACSCRLTREIILYDLTAFYKLQVTFCASESRCATDVERLAQLGFISLTASMPMTAFSFRLVEQAHASCKVNPSALIGYADGLKEFYSRCGWGRAHYTGPSWDNDLRKQLQRVVDEYRALKTCEKADSGDLLVGTVDSYANKYPACFGPTRQNQDITSDGVLACDGNFQPRETNSKHDVQGIVPDIFLGEEPVQAMKVEVETLVRPTEKACTESWKAADDDGAGSTSSSRVVDTGLVACVCRHDDVNLKMVNLERSGED